jgi:ribonuclease H2 subunit A
VYVDALGTTTTYEAYLSSQFPGINFTVCSKADAKFKIVGAASVAAKVTRDACIEGWVFEENINARTEPTQLWSAELGSGYPSGLLPCQSKTLVIFTKHYLKTPKLRLGSRIP